MQKPQSILAVGCLIWVASPLSAQDTEWNRYTLEDLEGVYLRAETAEACREFQVLTEEVTEEAHKVLEDEDIAVMSESEMLSSPGLPDLRITVDCSEGPDDTVAYSVWVRMQQAARMVRDPQLQLSEAVTWYTTSFGVVDDNKTRGAVEDAIEDTMEVFAAAFRAANPVEEADPS